MSYQSIKTILLSLAVLVSVPVNAGSTSSAQLPEVVEIQHEWARLYYLDEFVNRNYRELQELARRANRVATEHPDSAEALTWDAIVLSTLAEKKGGIGALSLVNEARRKLEKAETLNPTVLGGSVYASLGMLYAKVPGWPIAFGSEKQAERYLQKALALNPDGLDVNYFFAEFLAENGQDALALEYIDRALRAPQLEGRPIADAGRREQARKLRLALSAD